MEKEEKKKSLQLSDVRKNPMDAKNLSGKHYFADLLAEGLRQGMLRPETVQRLQAESLEILAERVQMLYGGKSSSVRIEKAQELLESVFYTAGAFLKESEKPEDALELLQKTSLAELFQKGQHILQRRLLSARVMQQRLKKNLLPTPNVFYRATIVDGISGFFKLYRPELFAQETHITADYPAFFPEDDLCGIEFIEDYLEKLFCENLFCRCFEAERIHELLLGLDEDYTQIPMNLYEPVLTAALCCVLTGQPAGPLICDRSMLRHLLKGKNREATEGLLRAALPALCEQIPDFSRSEKTSERIYLQKSLPALAGTLFRSMQHDCLDKVVLLPRIPIR